MRSIIAYIVHVAILLTAAIVVLNNDVDVNGYIIGILVGTFAAGFADGIKGKV